jgi:hypothetical protein
MNNVDYSTAVVLVSSEGFSKDYNTSDGISLTFRNVLTLINFRIRREVVKIVLGYSTFIQHFI